MLAREERELEDLEGEDCGGSGYSALSAEKSRYLERRIRFPCSLVDTPNIFVSFLIYVSTLRVIVCLRRWTRPCELGSHTRRSHRRFIFKICIVGALLNDDCGFCKYANYSDDRFTTDRRSRRLIVNIKN